MSSLRAALEEAIASNFDDRAAHAAYADYLQEQGDPRGELIGVQLALEDANLPAPERRRLQEREKELLAAHLPGWLGDVAPVLLSESYEENAFGLEYAGRAGTFRFDRGWLTSLEMDYCNTAFARGLGRCPTIRMLQRFGIEQAEYEEVEAGLLYPALAELQTLAGLRHFRLGPTKDHCHISGAGVSAAVARMPLLEELYFYAHNVDLAKVFALPLPRLRVLHVYHMEAYPLEVLADNPTLGSLDVLECYPHALLPEHHRAYIQPENFVPLVQSPYLRGLTQLRVNQSEIGDVGVRALVDSGMLRRLRVLNLDNGCVTDAGARLLADCPDLGRLEHLSIRGNLLTEEGVRALQAAGVSLQAERQFDAEDVQEDKEYLWEGDME